MPIQAFNSLLDPANLTRIEPLNLLARTAVEGFLSGLHRSVFHGFGSEFLQYRSYSPGEDLKYVDWKLYARSDRLYTKVYQEETNMNLYLVLDCSASHNYQGNGAACTKLRYSAMVAACLAYLASRQGDNISLLTYNDKITTYLPPGHRNQQLQRALIELTRMQPEGSARHEMAFDFLEKQASNRGLVVFISDMLEAENVLPGRLSRMRQRHCDCVALQVLDPDEINLPRQTGARFEDLESRREILTNPATIADQYNEQMEQFLRSLKTGFNQRQVDYRLLTSSTDLGQGLAAYLNNRERRF